MQPKLEKSFGTIIEKESGYRLILGMVSMGNCAPRLELRWWGPGKNPSPGSGIMLEGMDIYALKKSILAMERYFSG